MTMIYAEGILKHAGKTCARLENSMTLRIEGLIQQYSSAFGFLMLLQVAGYSYFYTIPIFNNHIFPHSWSMPYPSFKTWGEGRWFADMIILAQGSSGVQSFQMICATMLQAVNGILLAKLVGLTSRRAVLCVAGVLCMFPAFLDYYSFSIDHLSFVLGDTFALLGAWNLMRAKTYWGRVIGGAFFFLLEIAAYQPKIGVVSFLACGVVLLQLTQDRPLTRSAAPLRGALVDLSAAFLAVVGAVALYWAITKLFITTDFSAANANTIKYYGSRTHINTFQEAMIEISAAYRKTWAYFTAGMAGIPADLKFLPALALGFGVAGTLSAAWRKGSIILLLALFIAGLTPLAIHAPYVINNHSPSEAGRILAAYGYCFAFFVAMGLVTRFTRAVCTIGATVCLYFFVILATQESNAAAMKTMYDINTINRIVARAELVAGREDASQPLPVVIAGQYSSFDRAKYVNNFTGPLTPHITSYAFKNYRQVQMLNFFVGKDVFRSPTKAEVATAVESMTSKTPWPSDDSVYMVNGILVILLEQYRTDLPLTWTED